MSGETMKIITMYDTVDKKCQILMDGQELQDISAFSLSKYGPEGKYDCAIMKSTKTDDGMCKQETWSCYASLDKKSDAIKDLFKKD